MKKRNVLHKPWSVVRSAWLSALLLIVMMSGCIGSPGKSDHCVSFTPQQLAVNVTDLYHKKNIVPVLIIGSGPAGNTAASYAARAGFHTVIVKGNKPGGLLTETTYIENWPGITRILGTELMQQLAQQAEHCGALAVDDEIVATDLSQWPFAVTMSDGTILNALSIVIATGATPRTLGVQGEQLYWGKGVTTCAVCDAPFYKDKNVVIVGGGDSAAEQALQLAPHVHSITMLVRKNELRASRAMQDHIAALTNLTILFNQEIRAIEGNGTQVTGVSLFNNYTQESAQLPIDGVFLAIGHEPNTHLFKKDLLCSKQGYILVNGRTQCTSIAGIFAAGDVEDNVYRQAGIAAGDGIRASLDAQAFLHAIGIDGRLIETLKNNFFRNKKAEQTFVKEITTQEEYDQLIAQHKGPVVLDFYAEHCPSCMNMIPVFEATAKHFEGTATCVKVNVDYAPDIVRTLKVLKIPCLVVINEGALVARQHTVMNKGQMISLIEQFVTQAA